MKKIKKLRKGMTLLEVIVAMSIFSIGTAAVTMAFAAAVKYNSLNQRRDEELSYQQAAIQNGNTTGLQLLDGHDKDMEIKFKYPSGFTYTDKALDELAEKDTNLKASLGSVPKGYIGFIEKTLTGYSEYKPYTNLSEYKATKSGKNDGVYDFELKDFGRGTLGNTTVSWDKLDDKYKLRFTNTSDKSVDVQIQIKDGTIYEGSLDSGYRHASHVYTRAVGGTGSVGLEDSAGYISVPSTFEVGYYNINYATQTDTIKICVYRDGSLKNTLVVPNASLAGSTQGILDLTLDAGGTLHAVYTADN